MGECVVNDKSDGMWKELEFFSGNNMEGTWTPK